MASNERTTEAVMVKSASHREMRPEASAALIEPSAPPQSSKQNGGSVRSLARVVVVLRDQFLADATANTLVAHGILAIAFGRSEAARRELEGRSGIDVLVTSATFHPRCPNGTSLARITRRKHPCLKVIFVD